MKFTKSLGFIIFIVILVFVYFLYSTRDRIGNTQQSVKEVYLVATEFPPFYGEKLPGGGFVSEIITKTFNDAGYEVKIDFLPWDMAVNNAKDGVYDALYTAWPSEEREEDFLYSTPFIPNELSFFKMRESDIEFTSYQDLDVKVGVVKDYTYIKEFWESDLDIDLSIEERDIFQKLINNKVSVVLADKIVAQDILNNIFPESRDDIEMVGDSLDSLDQHVIFPKIRPRSEDLRGDFNKSFKKLVSSGEFSRILKKYNFEM